jgi:DnaJ-domain-containing protein 1
LFSCFNSNLHFALQVNKGEAERCRDIGRSALQDGNSVRAQKFFKKSLQLYPSADVEELLKVAQQQERSNGAAPQKSPPKPAQQQQKTGADGRNYTDEQVRVVNNVLTFKEGGRGAHYRILGLQQDATDALIKKAYRKLSLKVHPDKNAAPHADEAFKAVGLAYATLSDPQKRHIYDQYGQGRSREMQCGRRDYELLFVDGLVIVDSLFHFSSVLSISTIPRGPRQSRRWWSSW